MIKCTLPWTQLNIAVGDTVRVCCWAKVPIGRLEDFPTLEAAWNGPAIRAFRRAMSTGEVEGICSEFCPHLQNGNHTSDKFDASGSAGTSSRKAIRDAIENKKETVAVPPLRLTASLDDVCSLSCIMCTWNSGRFRIHPNFYTLLDTAAPALEDLELLGGEPFSSRQVLDLLKHADQHPPAYEFSFITSLIRLPLTLLRKVRLKQIIVSIDGATKETYEKVRIGARWETVMENLSRLLEFHRAAPKPFHLQVHFTVMGANLHEIPEAVRLFNRLGVPLYFAPVLGPTEDNLWDPGFHGPLAAALNKATALSRYPLTTWSLRVMRDLLRRHVARSVQVERTR